MNEKHRLKNQKRLDGIVLNPLLSPEFFKMSYDERIIEFEEYWDVPMIMAMKATTLQAQESYEKDALAANPPRLVLSEKERTRQHKRYLAEFSEKYPHGKKFCVFVFNGVTEYPLNLLGEYPTTTQAIEIAKNINGLKTLQVIMYACYVLGIHKILDRRVNK